MDPGTMAAIVATASLSSTAATQPRPGTAQPRPGTPRQLHAIWLGNRCKDHWKSQRGLIRHHHALHVQKLLEADDGQTKKLKSKLKKRMRENCKKDQLAHREKLAEEFARVYRVMYKIHEIDVRSAKYWNKKLAVKAGGRSLRHELKQLKTSEKHRAVVLEERMQILEIDYTMNYDVE